MANNYRWVLGRILDYLWAEATSGKSLSIWSLVICVNVNPTENEQSVCLSKRLQCYNAGSYRRNGIRQT